MEKEYFTPGEIVTLKQDIPNKPIMIVVKKKSLTIKNKDSKSNFFQGMVCRWFTTTGEMQEALFSTKDLIKITKK